MPWVIFNSPWLSAIVPPVSEESNVITFPFPARAIASRRETTLSVSLQSAGSSVVFTTHFTASVGPAGTAPAPAYSNPAVTAKRARSSRDSSRSLREEIRFFMESSFRLKVVDDAEICFMAGNQSVLSFFPEIRPVPQKDGADRRNKVLPRKKVRRQTARKRVLA